jgi:hypothetical protein
MRLGSRVKMALVPGSGSATLYLTLSRRCREVGGPAAGSWPHAREDCPAPSPRSGRRRPVADPSPAGGSGRPAGRWTAPGTYRSPTMRQNSRG